MIAVNTIGRSGLIASSKQLEEFSELVRREGALRYRSLPWRNISDAWLVLLSEVMLQQTQVKRVIKYWQDWVERFPTPDALAAASTSDVLEAWQGLGYNRRALALKKAAEQIELSHAGELPKDYETLLTLPGVGKATAAGVCIFAYQQPQVYLETNVRTVFLHHFFLSSSDVADKELIPLLALSCDQDDPRAWYYALLDYGNYLKATLPNPSRASRHYTRQSRFEGSLRQKRASLTRELIALRQATSEDLTKILNAIELAAGRDALDVSEVVQILQALAEEGFLACVNNVWMIAA